MATQNRLHRLREQREALVGRIKEARIAATAAVTVPSMLLALEALDDLIAREEGESRPSRD